MTDRTVLQNVTVLEVTESVAGALCGRLLAELGADVVLVEPQDGHALRALGPDGAVFETVAVGKRSVVLADDELGAAVGGADVLLVDDRAPAMGYDAETVEREHPDTTYCSVTPFGRNAEGAQNAIDPSVQAASGLTATSGFPGRPPAVTAVPVAAAFAAVVACGAVLKQVYDGAVGDVDVSMQDSVLPLLTTFLPEQFATDGPVEPIGNRHPIVAPWNTYEALDGWVYVIALTDRDWERLLDVVDRDDLRDDPRFETAHERRRNVDAIDEVVGEWVAERTVDEVLERAERHDLTAARIRDVSEFFADENLAYRGMVVESGGHTVAGSPFALSESPGRVESPAPDLDDHGGEPW